MSAVNHPDHYNKHPSGIECIDIIEHYNFNVGNTIKYVWRAGLKGDAIEDLEKAAWYLQREIELRKKANQPKVQAQATMTNADTLKAIRSLMGYVENGSSTVVTLFQDDATKDYYCKVGDKSSYWGSSLIEAVSKAIAANPPDL